MKSLGKMTAVLLTTATLSFGMLADVKPVYAEPSMLSGSQQQSSVEVPEPGTLFALALVAVAGFFLKKKLSSPKE